MDGPHLVNVFFGFKREKKGGNIKRSALGELLSKGKDTRVETANEGRFSSRICSERVDPLKESTNEIDSPNFL